MNVTGIEQGQGPLGQVANALSSASKSATAVQSEEQKAKEESSPLQTGNPEEQGVKVEISRAAQALSQSAFSSQQESEGNSSLLDKN